MLITVHGRLEADPMWVPAPVAQAPTSDDSFAQELQARLAEVEQAPASEPTASEQPATDAEQGSTPPVADELATEQEVAAEQVALDEPTEPAFAQHQFAANATIDTSRQGEPVRHESAGKGADSPRRATSPLAELARTEVLQNLGAGQASPVSTSAAAPTGPATAAPTTLNNTGSKAIAPQFALPQTAKQVTASAAGYRTQSASSAQLLEQARDSIFKQILMKIDDKGGELRMRLEPPQLGELDLLLTVDQGRLHLAIRTERADLAAMMQQHLDELRHALQDAGLSVAGAQVEARSEGASRDLREFDFATGNRRDDDHSAVPAPRFGGTVTAQGLDFWA